MEDTALVPERLAGGPLAAQLAARCVAFVHPLLVQLDAELDCRLVRTLAHSVVALVQHRHRALALWLSELGAYLAGPQHAPAGTKRLANLLHSPRWQATAIQAYLLEQGRAQVGAAAARVPEGRALCILDGSVLEKPESAQADGLTPVRSAKARRLARPRPQQGPGYYRGKPGPPIVVPGWRWLAAVVTAWDAPGAARPLTLGAWQWYAKPLPADHPVPTATAGVHAADRAAQQQVLATVTAAWGAERLLHVWDREFAGAPWLGEALDQDWHFVVRWKKGNHLRPATAPSVGDPTATPTQQEHDGVAAWRLTAGLRPWGTRQLPHPRHRGQWLTVRFAARPVRLVHRADPLWLVVARLDRGGCRRGRLEPWRLLTTEPVTTEAECWRIVEAYWARWAVEQQFRYAKSELGVESIRVRDWDAREKLLALVALTYAFLLHLLGDGTDPCLPPLLRWAHRTGTQARDRWQPLYRLRAALAALWTRHTPSLQGLP
jgi:hypothetical protein